MKKNKYGNLLDRAALTVAAEEELLNLIVATEKPANEAEFRLNRRAQWRAIEAVWNADSARRGLDFDPFDQLCDTAGVFEMLRDIDKARFAEAMYQITRG